MRMSVLFSQTLREAPADADIASHQLLLRAGYIRQLGAGIFSHLPLAERSLRKIEQIIRDEMDKIGGQELSLPVVHPADIWKETGRWTTVDVLTRFEDRGGRDMVLAVTHEEVIGDLARNEIESYRQLPVLLYQIQTKWRDEPRARGGLIRVREFTMKDSYSLDADEAGLDKQYKAHYQAYFNIYHRCGLAVISVASDTGMMGGKLAHEYMYLTAIGEDTLLINQETGYAANREVAKFLKPPAPEEEPAELEKVETPDTKTIDDLAALLDIPKAKTAKAVFMMATRVNDDDEESQILVFAVIRGDMEINEVKLINAVGAKSMRAATEAEIASVGAVPGYASPVGISRESVVVIVDDSVVESPNLVAGANEAGYHLLNVNYGRDYEADIVADIAAARAGDRTPDGEGILEERRGVEVGNIFKLGTRYSDSLGATFLDENGKRKPIVMGSYGIGVERLFACIAEEYNDDYGLILPITVAPYEVHLVLLPGDESDPIGEELYAELQQAGIEVLYDDRDERPGVKFNDADLIGVPIRLTVSRRSLEQGGIEFKRRDQGKDETRIIAYDDVIRIVQDEIAALHMAIQETVVEVPYRE